MHGTSSPGFAWHVRTLLLVCNYACNCVVTRQKVTVDSSYFSTNTGQQYSFYHCAGVALVCLCSRLLHTVTCTSVLCFVICVRCRWTLWRTLAPCQRKKASCLEVLSSLTMTHKVVPPLPVILVDDVSQKVWLNMEGPTLKSRREYFLWCWKVGSQSTVSSVYFYGAC